MKTLAICFSGSLRSIEKTYQNFLDNVYYPNIDNFDITLFYYIPEDINSPKINIINKNILSIVKLEKDKKLDLPKIYWKGRPNNASIDKASMSGLFGYIQQLYGIQNVYKLLLDYENNNNINFDFILRCRSDVIFKNKLNLNNYCDDKIHIPSFHAYHGINDRLAFGKSKIMSIYMNMYENIYKYSNDFNIFLEKKFNIKSINIISEAEVFCKYNLDINNVKYHLENDIKFNRVRMNGIISNDC